MKLYQIFGQKQLTNDAAVNTFPRPDLQSLFLLPKLKRAMRERCEQLNELKEELKRILKN